VTLEVRAAVAEDADQVATLHTDSWRRFYRGAFSDSYLDGDVLSDRRLVWGARLAQPSHAATVVAQDDGGIAGFVHVILDHDDQWGSLVDNLHVRHDLRRAGLGRVLLTRAAEAVAGGAKDRRMYLWVLEQNTNAQGFYAAMGGVCVEKSLVSPPGGVPDRLNGSPGKLRMAWADVAVPELTR
jgi:ribosomal protein S18 acetylase RimI-like enzyme